MAKRKRKDDVKAEEKRPINKKTLKKLAGIFQFMLPYRGMFLLGILSLVVSTFTILAFPRLAGELIDVATGQGTYFTSINEGTVALLIVLTFFIR